jgi:hypothetical protein
VTNGNYNVQPLLKRLDKISIRWLMLSLDSVNPETYAKIRKGGNLARTLKTLESLAEFNQIRERGGRDFDFSISMCVQRDNWTEIESFFNYCFSVRVRPWLQFAYQPSSLSLLSMPLEERMAVKRQLAPLADTYGAEPIGVILRVLDDSFKAEGSGHELRF